MGFELEALELLPPFPERPSARPAAPRPIAVHNIFVDENQLLLSGVVVDMEVLFIDPSDAVLWVVLGLIMAETLPSALCGVLIPTSVEVSTVLDSTEEASFVLSVLPLLPTEFGTTTPKPVPAPPVVTVPKASGKTLPTSLNKAAAVTSPSAKATIK